MTEVSIAMVCRFICSFTCQHGNSLQFISAVIKSCIFKLFSTQYLFPTPANGLFGWIRSRFVNTELKPIEAQYRIYHVNIIPAFFSINLLMGSN